MRIFSCQLKKRCLARSIAGSAAIPGGAPCARWGGDAHGTSPRALGARREGTPLDEVVWATDSSRVRNRAPVTVTLRPCDREKIPYARQSDNLIATSLRLLVLRHTRKPYGPAGVPACSGPECSIVSDRGSKGRPPAPLSPAAASARGARPSPSERPQVTRVALRHLPRSIRARAPH